jgi:hypothetical protein
MRRARSALKLVASTISTSTTASTRSSERANLAAAHVAVVIAERAVLAAKAAEERGSRMATDAAHARDDAEAALEGAREATTASVGRAAEGKGALRLDGLAVARTALVAAEDALEAIQNARPALTEKTEAAVSALDAARQRVREARAAAVLVSAQKLYDMKAAAEQRVAVIDAALTAAIEAIKPPADRLDPRTYVMYRDAGRDPEGQHLWRVTEQLKAASHVEPPPRDPVLDPALWSAAVEALASDADAPLPL